MAINIRQRVLWLPTSHYDKPRLTGCRLCPQSAPHEGQVGWEAFYPSALAGANCARPVWRCEGDGKRQFRSAYVEIPKKNGKSELAAAIALYLLFADNEMSAEVYGAASDRQQASIVFDVAKQMVEMSPALTRRCKIMGATKRIVNYSNSGFYQVLSAEVGTKHGFNVSGLVFDEIHAQPNRKLYDVLTKGSGDAREQPLFFIITTAGTDRNSICYELHTTALDLMNGGKSTRPSIRWFTALLTMMTGRMKPTGTRRTHPSATP